MSSTQQLIPPRYLHNNTLNSTTKLGIDLVILLLLIMNLIYIPIELCFSQSVSFDSSILLYLLLKPFSVFAFFLEIITHLNTAIYVNGLVIKNRKEIFINYAKSAMWWDLVAIVPLMLGIHFEIGFLKLVIIVRFLDILSLIQDVEDRFQFKDRFRGQCQLVKLIFFILCLAHLIACAWYKLAALQHASGVPITWVEGDSRDSNSSSIIAAAAAAESSSITSTAIPSNNEFHQLYVRSFYWTIVTMTTLGYGDITPQTQLEQIFAISVGLLSTVVFAFSVSSIGEILKEISKKQTEFRLKMSSIELYMKKRNLDQNLRLKVRKYFAYLNKEEQQDTHEGATHLQKLAASLREEVFVDMYGRLLKSKKIFDLHFSTQFLNQLALKMKEASIAPESIIYEQTQPGNRLYFVINGEVEMVVKMKGERESYRRLCTIKEGQIFGELEFFSGQVRENTARSVNVTSLVYVEFTDFLETLKAFPLDYEQLVQIRDNINLYSKTKGLDHKCSSCGNFDHRLSTCPLVNYIPNTVKILKRFNVCQDQPRNSSLHSRSDFRTVKTLRQLAHLKQSAIRIHFVLFNEQLMQQQEQLSQLSYECELVNESYDQSPSIIYHNNVINSNQQQAHNHQQQQQESPNRNRINRKRVIEQELREQLPTNGGFHLNPSFIADETPKYHRNQSVSQISKNFNNRLIPQKLSVVEDSLQQLNPTTSFINSDINKPHSNSTNPLEISEPNQPTATTTTAPSMTSISSKSKLSQMAKNKPIILSLKRFSIPSSSQQISRIQLGSRSPIKEEEESASHYYNFNDRQFPSIKIFHSEHNQDSMKDFESEPNSPPMKNITSLDDLRSFSPPSKQKRASQQNQMIECQQLQNDIITQTKVESSLLPRIQIFEVSPAGEEYLPKTPSKSFTQNHQLNCRQTENCRQFGVVSHFEVQTGTLDQNLHNSSYSSSNSSSNSSSYSSRSCEQEIIDSMSQNKDENVKNERDLEKTKQQQQQYPCINIFKDCNIDDQQEEMLSAQKPNQNNKNKEGFLKITSMTFAGSPTPTTAGGTTGIHSGDLQQTFAMNSSFTCSQTPQYLLHSHSNSNTLSFSSIRPITATVSNSQIQTKPSMNQLSLSQLPRDVHSSMKLLEPNNSQKNPNKIILDVQTQQSEQVNQLRLSNTFLSKNSICKSSPCYQNNKLQPFASQQNLKESCSSQEIPTWITYNNQSSKQVVPQSHNLNRLSKLIQIRARKSQIREQQNNNIISQMSIPFGTGTKIQRETSFSSSNLKQLNPNQSQQQQSPFLIPSNRQSNINSSHFLRQQTTLQNQQQQQQQSTNQFGSELSPCEYSNTPLIPQEGLSMSVHLTSGSGSRLIDSVEDFDRLKIFTKYFVKNNVEIVLNAFNRSRKSKATFIRIHQQNIRKKKKNLFTASKFTIQRIALAEQKATLEHQIIQKSSNFLALKSRRKSLFYTSPKHDLTTTQIADNQFHTSEKIIPSPDFN